ncbi:MAG: hypothetical protein ABIA63_09625, partial [bacterium]
MASSANRKKETTQYVKQIRELEKINKKLDQVNTGLVSDVRENKKNLSLSEVRLNEEINGRRHIEEVLSLRQAMLEAI